MSGCRPWSEIRRKPIKLDATNEREPEVVLDATDSDMWDEHRALVADSVPSYEDLPEHVSWLDRKGGIKRDDFAD